MVHGTCWRAGKSCGFITQNTLQELRSLYSAELPENITSLPEALSLINDATQKRFVIIIDEWDVLIRDASADTKNSGFLY